MKAGTLSKGSGGKLQMGEAFYTTRKIFLLVEHAAGRLYSTCHGSTSVQQMSTSICVFRHVMTPL